jgi:large subunit ribosomal protein L22
MNVQASARFIRQSPTKVRQVLDLVRGRHVPEAYVILDYADRRSADPIRKLLDSAVANAEHNYALDAGELTVRRAFADAGPTLKRFRPRARGRVARIEKRTSHVTIVLSDGRPDEHTTADGGGA